MATIKITDRARFIELAPQYYALAVTVIFLKSRKPGKSSFSLSDLQWSMTDPFDAINGADDERVSLLGQEILLSAGINWLETRGMVEWMNDDFADPVLLAGPELWPKFQRLKEDQDSPFGRFAKADESEDWLKVSA